MRIDCPNCRHAIQIADKWTGILACPKCKTQLQVLPQEPALPEPPIASAAPPTALPAFIPTASPASASAPPEPAPPPLPSAPAATPTKSFAVSTTAMTEAGYRRRLYPAAEVISWYFHILGWLVIAANVIGLGYLVYELWRIVPVWNVDTVSRLMVVVSVGLIAAFVQVALLWFLGESLRIMIDIEDNTHRTEFALNRLTALMSPKDS